MEHTHIPLHNEVDGNTLTAEAARATDAMNVNFRFLRQIVIDDQPAHLPHVDTVIHVIGGDEHTGGTRTELLHDELTLLLGHVTVHGRNGEITLGHLVGEPVDL